MVTNNYEIIIKSPHPDVREVINEKGTFWVGVPGETYTVKIKNNDSDYRIWASLHVDGVDVMDKKGWGLIAEPNSSLSWDGFRMDQNTVREFVFLDDPKKSIAVLKGIKDRVGFINIEIVREKETWDSLKPAPVMSFKLMTGMGDFKESTVREAKIKFRWGGLVSNMKLDMAPRMNLI